MSCHHFYSIFIAPLLLEDRTHHELTLRLVGEMRIVEPISKRRRKTER